MVAVESPHAKVGKFTFDIKPSTESAPDSSQRSEAIAAWLLSQWNKRQAERN